MEFSLDGVDWYPLAGNELGVYALGWCYLREHIGDKIVVREWVKN
jgi:hypothetical protein